MQLKSDDEGAGLCGGKLLFGTLKHYYFKWKKVADGKFARGAWHGVGILELLSQLDKRMTRRQVMYFWSYNYLRSSTGCSSNPGLRSPVKMSD